jgi:superfamily II DNA or RNA helicase
LTTLSIAPDDIITSIQLPEPAKVIQVIQLGTQIRIMAVGLETNQFYDRTFTPDEISVRRVTFAADGERFRLAALAERIRAAAQYDPQFAIGVSQIDPLPHQIDAVYNHLLRSPRIRFLLADDPGAGKTIMAGLLLKELENRGAVERVLVVTPANLTMQWRDEMRDRFSTDFTIIRREQLAANAGSDLWRQHPRAIMSVDFGKRDEVRATFDGAKWDLVIIDEAHRMAAYQYGEKVDKTRAYQLGEELSKQTDHLLLMTATPHRGNADNFRLLLSLLDPDIFQSNEGLAEMLRQSRMPIFLRRLKERMVDFDNKPLFPPRKVETVPYTLTGIEKDLYDAVTDYVAKRFQRAEQLTDERARRNVGLALMVLQRRLASSLRAIRTSLARREEKLQEKLQAVRTGSVAPAQLGLPLAIDDSEEEDEERWEQEEQALGVTLAMTVREIELEIQEVHELHELALLAEEEAERTDCERKLAELRGVMGKPLVDGRNLWESGEKLLVFTENRDTLNYLVEKFMAWGFRVAQIYGGMSQDDRRAAQKYFKADDGAQIMVATEAAGEGINLQFCRLMVNYDIPWNPNRLEQRMGRIHRYGQKFSVRIFNLVAENTREGYVLATVLDKLDQMRTDLGREHVFDIIGDLLTTTDLADLVQRAVKERQSLEAIQAAVISTVDANEQRRKAQAALADALAADLMSPAALDEIREQLRTAKEQRLVPEYVERFVVTAFRVLCRDHKLRADIRPRASEPGVWTIESVPHFIRLAAPAGRRVLPAYGQIIFTKALAEDYPKAEFVAPGHPLFDALLTLVRGTYGKLLTEGAQFAAAPSDQGLFWLLEATVKDGTGAIAGQKLVGVYQRADGTLEPQDPLTLLDYEPLATSPEEAQGVALPEALKPLASAPTTIENWAKDHIIDPYLDQLRERRQHEANVREEYLQRSLDTLIADQTAKVLAYAADDKARKRDAGQWDIGLRTLEQGLEEYQARLQRRIDESTRLRAVGADVPRIAGVCAYVPVPDVLANDEEGDDPDVEAVAVAVAMGYERDNGREPQSVEADSLGFDLRSKGPNEIRYIEVKGRRGTGGVMLTANEWIKAARFGKEYWLYVVHGCGGDSPRLTIIHDPASCLTVSEQTFTAARFRVNAGEISKNGVVVAADMPVQGYNEDP